MLESIMLACFYFIDTPKYGWEINDSPIGLVALEFLNFKIYCDPVILVSF